MDTPALPQAAIGKPSSVQTQKVLLKLIFSSSFLEGLFVTLWLNRLKIKILKMKVQRYQQPSTQIIDKIGHSCNMSLRFTRVRLYLLGFGEEKGETLLGAFADPM